MDVFFLERKCKIFDSKLNHCHILWIFTVNSELHLCHGTIWEVVPGHWLEKVAATFRNLLAGVWMSHLSVTVHHGLAPVKQINETYDFAGEGNSQRSHVGAVLCFSFDEEMFSC